MHQQIRTVPAASPPDVEQFLAVIADIQLLAVGGGDVEQGGEIAIVVRHADQDEVMRRLGAYHPRIVDVDHALLSNRAGALSKFVAKVAAENRRKGLRIKDITVGLPDPDEPADSATFDDDAKFAGQKVLVQIYSA